MSGVIARLGLTGWILQRSQRRIGNGLWALGSGRRRSLLAPYRECAWRAALFLLKCVVHPSDRRGHRQDLSRPGL